MNDSASGLSKVLLQVIPRDFSKFSPVITPGNYTALVSGVGGTTGTALVEVYDESASP
jgi:hypothetical protein